MDGVEREARSSAIIPAIDTASSTAAIRSLGKRSIRTVAVSEHEHPPGFSSRYCDERISVPDPTVDLSGYEQALVDLARREDVLTVLPFREPDVFVLARRREELADHVGTPWPTLETLRLVQDRVELARVAEAAGVAMPRTKPMDEWDDWSRRAIIKPRYTMHAPEYADRFNERRTELGSTTYVPQNTEPDREHVVEEMGHVPIVQEYVPTTDEYGFFALYDHGEPVATFQHRQRRGWKYAGGASAYRESIAIEELESAGTSLLDELDWHGVAMVEFLRDPETGEFKLMELNPRFWSSLPFTVQAGVDFPYLYWLQAAGRTISRPPTYEVGIAGHLLWGEFLHLHSILTEEYPLVERPSFAGSLRDIVTSVVRDRRFDYLDLDDPSPFVRDLSNSMKSHTPELRGGEIGRWIPRPGR